MASLELEARLDNLLYTAREETADYNLFAPIPLREECPICMLPLPIVNNETIFMKCCGKSICMGCICRNLITEETKVEDYKCALCCQPNPKTIKALKKLMKRNNHEAFIQMANHYEEGDGVIQSNTKSLEMIFRAAELGHSAAFGMIGSYYQDGMAVKQDLSKALEFYEVAAKKGSIEGHKALTQSHENNGNINEAIEHLKVVASVGDVERD